jgi:protein LSM12
MSLIGSQIRLTLVPSTTGEKDRIHEGSFWCYDSVTGVVVVESPPADPSPSSSSASFNNPRKSNNAKDYHIVKISQVKSIEFLNTVSTNVSNPNLTGVNVNLLAQKEREAVKREELRRSRIGKGVSERGQAMFDALSKT